MSDPADPQTLGIVTDVGAVAGLGSAALKLITALQEEANSPDMVKAAIARNKLARMDALAAAQRNDDLLSEQIAAESAGQ
jgi:hypothetical protein